MAQLPVVWNHLSVNICPGAILVILKCNQDVAWLWNAGPTIFEMQAAILVICKMWATIQPICELRAVS